jgi:hypothetical protein
MQKTLTSSQSRGDQAGSKTASHGSSSSKHRQPRAIVLTCAILWYCFLLLSTSHTKKPILIDSIFSQLDKLQLRFHPMGNYAASTFTSHIRIPFDYSALLNLQDKMIEHMDRCIPDLDHFNFKLDQYNRATLNSTFELYKSYIKHFWKLFMTFLQAFLTFQNASNDNGTSPLLSLPPPLSHYPHTTRCRGPSSKQLSRPRNRKHIYLPTSSSFMKNTYINWMR